MSQCLALTLQGERCKNDAIEGSIYCKQHKNYGQKGKIASRYGLPENLSKPKIIASPKSPPKTESIIKLSRRLDKDTKNVPKSPSKKKDILPKSPSKKETIVKSPKSPSKKESVIKSPKSPSKKETKSSSKKESVIKSSISPSKKEGIKKLSRRPEKETKQTSKSVSKKEDKSIAISPKSKEKIIKLSEKIAKLSKKPSPQKKKLSKRSTKTEKPVVFSSGQLSWAPVASNKRLISPKWLDEIPESPKSPKLSKDLQKELKKQKKLVEYVGEKKQLQLDKEKLIKENKLAIKAASRAAQELLLEKEKCRETLQDKDSTSNIEKIYTKTVFDIYNTELGAVKHLCTNKNSAFLCNDKTIWKKLFLKSEFPLPVKMDAMDIDALVFKFLRNKYIGSDMITKNFPYYKQHEEFMVCYTNIYYKYLEFILPTGVYKKLDEPSIRYYKYVDIIFDFRDPDKYKTLLIKSRSQTDRVKDYIHYKENSQIVNGYVLEGSSILLYIIFSMMEFFPDESLTEIKLPMTKKEAKGWLEWLGVK